jgi:predicted enzyme related to lactoylglutathione lyase
VTVTELFAGVPVADLPAALAWYERLLGGTPAFHPNDDEAVWRVAGGWIYVVRDAARAGNALVTLLVDDLDAEVAALMARGIETGPIETIPGAVRTAQITDPEGNRIQFGQPETPG